MRNIAVTGSFASGKTHIINYIKNLGYKVFSCDDYVKLLYQDKTITDQIEQEIKGLDIEEHGLENSYADFQSVDINM